MPARINIALKLRQSFLLATVSTNRGIPPDVYSVLLSYFNQNINFEQFEMCSRSSIDSLSSALSDTSVTSFESLKCTSMRVFLIQTARGLFSSSGGYKSNICLLRYLISRGHSVRQLCYFHRNEVDDYIQKMVLESGLDIPVHRKTLHLSSSFNESGVDVDVVRLTMEDGVEIVALQKEAFDVAFGGRENIHKEMSRETAGYIEVTKSTTSNHRYRQASC